MLRLAELSLKTEKIKEKARKLFNEAGMELEIIDKDDRPIKLVFVGQYSAGKSTIIKMLTQNEDIAIGADITTEEVHSYIWNGIEIVDTPGVHTKLRPDHDEISYEAIASADMLVFVVTNELFDDHLSKHFRRLAIDKDKGGEMLLVVNKMERTSLGNVDEQREIIREDLKNVLVPFTPEQLGLTFIDAKTFLESLEEVEPEISDELRLRSGYNEFIDSLNHFINSKSLSSRLTTVLYEIDSQLEKAIISLQPKSEDNDIDALEENYMQQRNELFDSRNRLQQEIRDIYTSSSMKIRTLGTDSAALITEGCKQENVEKSLEEAIENANEIIKECENNAINVLETRMREIDRAIDALEHSEFAQQLIIHLENKFDKLPPKIQMMLGKGGEVAKQASVSIMNNVYKTGVHGGLKLSNFSQSTVHNIVLKAGHTLGYKFKPWQAIKITRGIAVGGQVLGILGVGISVFMQIKEDHDELKRNELIRENRQNIRGQFYTVASELEDSGNYFIEQNVSIPLDESIRTLDDNITEIRNTRTGKNELCMNFEMLQKECQELISEIHSS